MSTRTFSGVNAAVDITGAKILGSTDSGKHFVLRAATGAAVTLPAASTKFEPITITVGSSFATTDWTVVTSGSENVLQGSAEVAGAVVVGVAEDTITFVASAESIGDTVTFSSDGTSIFFKGVAALSGGITATAT